MNSTSSRLTLFALVQIIVFSAFYLFARHALDGVHSAAGGGSIPAGSFDTPQMPPKPQPLQSLAPNDPMSPSPEAGNNFEDALDQLLAVGDFEAALHLVFSQPNRSDANDVFALKLVNHLGNPEAIGAFLKDLSLDDRSQICGHMLKWTDKPLDLLHSMRDVFPRGPRLRYMLEGYIRHASADKVPEILEFVNTMPDSPLRQALILEALVKRGFEDKATVEQSLAVLPTNKARDQYVKAVRQSYYYRDLSEAGRASYQHLFDQFFDASPTQ